MSTNVLLRTAAVLWIVWGIVHAFAKIMTISHNTASAVSGLADAIGPLILKLAYPDAVGAIINQHGFNLPWFGLATFE